MIHQKKTGVTVRPRSLNPEKAIARVIWPIICSFYYLVRSLMHDMACEFVCAVGCAETISANVLKLYLQFLDLSHKATRSIATIAGKLLFFVRSL